MLPVAGITGIADQLVIPDADRFGRIIATLEHGHHRADTPAVICPLQMTEQRFGHLLRGFSPTGINNLQCVPEQPSDAAAVMPPGHFGAMGQLFCCMAVGATLPYFLTHSPGAFTQLSRRFPQLPVT
ncbi:hypothetical protein D3C80_1800540 [compost metagenome]